MKMLCIEYLVINDISGAFCDSIDTFNKLLQASSNIKIDKNTLEFKKNLKAKYLIQSGQLKSQNQRFFHISLSVEEKKSIIGPFTELAREIKTIIYNSGNKPETLWDDVSFYFAKESYPLIYEIENLLRKLITQFMLTTIGTSWVDISLPAEVKSAIANTKRNDYINVLHQVDFIHLADFLFKPYQTTDSLTLFKKLEKAESLNDLNLSDLQGYVPRSNWERYFADLVKCEDTYLKKRWATLYELRCKVAHNAFINRIDLEQVTKITEELKEVFTLAMNSLDRVYVPQEKRDEVAESVTSNLNVLYAQFVQEWKLLTRRLIELATFHKIKVEKASFRSTCKELFNLGYISQAQYQNLNKIGVFRNDLVHPGGKDISQDETNSYIRLIGQCLREIESS